MNFEKFLRTPVLQNSSERLLLKKARKEKKNNSLNISQNRNKNSIIIVLYTRSTTVFTIKCFVNDGIYVKERSEHAKKENEPKLFTVKLTL